MKKSTVIFLFYFVLSFSLKAQCYLQKTEASGFNLAQFQASLNQAACSLKDSLPIEFQSQFKVLAYGLYTLAPSFNTGITSMLTKAKLEAENESQYYLLFVRESSSNGLFTKFHVEIKLPNTGAFSCVDSAKNQIIKQSVIQAINNQYQTYDNNPSFYSQAETAGMDVLSKILGAIKGGNCCVPTDEAVENWLISEGFVKLAIPGSNYNNPKVLGPISAKSEPLQQRNNDFVTDFSNTFVQVNGQPLNLESGINEVLVSNNYSSEDPKFFIIKNQSICNDEYETAMSQISANLPKVGGIVYVQDKLFGPDNLYLKVMGMTLAEIPNFVADLGEYEEQGGCGATSFQDLINTVRQAEDSLIAHGYTDVDDRVKILRGLYYGTDWSMDRAQSYGSTLRNNGFKLYLCDAIEPINPQQILGSGLFQKLMCSPEVKNGTLGVDWGHIIIGMEARLNWCSREQEVLIPPHETSGLEITTWIGDIGGGAGMLAFKRITSPNKRAIDMFNDPNDFGGWFNIEGDIAAYLVGRNTAIFDHTPEVELTNLTIADALQAYLLPQPAPAQSEYNKRGRLFLAMLGGVVDAQGNLTNEQDLVNHLVPKIQDFAEYYLVNMSFGRTIDFEQASRHLGGASREIASLFINALKSVGYAPNTRAHPNNYNPDPTPPGEPYENVKFTSRERAAEIRRQIEDWINNH